MWKHFTNKEMACKHCGKNEMQDVFMEALEAMRIEYGKPMIVTSGYRCREHNKAIGGAKYSQHLRGNAVDIKCDRSQRYQLIKVALKHGFTGIEVSPWHVHLDRRKNGTMFLLMDKERGVF